MKSYYNDNLLPLLARSIQSIENDKFVLLIPLLTILTRLIIFIFIPLTYEDAYITFRYAENLAAGSGLVYNIGETVYGTTAPLFAIILAMFKLIGIPCIISSLAINLLAEGITSLIVYKLLKNYANSKLAVIPALLYVFSPSNISWSISGMETAFFTAFIALSFFSLINNKYFLAMLLGTICAIIRIDGLSVTAIIFIFILFKQKKSSFKIVLIPMLIFVFWELFLYLYFQSFLPNSMMAKLIIYSGHRTSMVPNLGKVLSKFFIKGYYLSSIITIAFLVGIVVVFCKKINYYSMIIWFFIYYSALIISKTLIHGWYYIPPLFTFITISGIAILYIYDHVSSYFKKSESLLRLVFIIGVLLFSSSMLYLKIIQMKSELHFEKNIRMKIGEFLNKNTPENATVFLEPIGVIGYYSERYIYDDVALISPIFLELNRLPNTAKTRYKKIELVKPDYFILRYKYLEEFISNTNLMNDYTAIKEFEYYRDSENLGFIIFSRNDNIID